MQVIRRRSRFNEQIIITAEERCLMLIFFLLLFHKYCPLRTGLGSLPLTRDG